MQGLVDTHSILWYADNDQRLSAVAFAILADPANILRLSVASLWEIAIKVSVGKLQLGMPYRPFVDKLLADYDLQMLPIDLSHLTTVSALPMHHRDPFDRLIIAQALAEGLPVVSADPVFDRYGVQRIW